MKVYETNIFDKNIKDINEYKVKLLDKITYNISPYIKKDINSSIVNIKKKRKLFKQKKNELINIKNELDEKLKILNHKKKINLLLNRALQLLSIKAFDDQNVKREVAVMLKMIDDLPEEKLDFYLSEMMRIITNKFSQIEVKD